MKFYLSNTKELRLLDGGETQQRTICGYAAVFEQRSNYLGWFETIKRGAITDDVIKRSNVVACLNHNDMDILARSKNGEGTLRLSVDEIGLRFEFDVPNTSLGNDVLELVERGDIYQCSFGFSLDPDDDTCQRWYRNEEGELCRDIYRINELFDVSPCSVRTAYEATPVYARSIDEMLEEVKNTLDNVENRAVEEPVETVEEPETVEVDNDATDVVEEPTEPETEVVEQTEENELENEAEPEGDDGDTTEEADEEIIELKQNKIKMNKQFSILSAINAVANNRSLDEATSKIIEMGREEMRSCGFNAQGQITLPECRSGVTATVTDQGENIVETEYMSILAPLRDRLVLTEAGAHFLNGLKGDVRVPRLSAQNVAWATEVALASSATTETSGVTLKPHRLTAYVDISKQFLIQDSVGAENMIRTDLVNAIAEKLQKTILSDGEEVVGSTPAGILNGLEKGSVSAFKDLCDLEADVEDENVYGECVYVGSNKAKAGLRSMAKGSKSTQLVYENGAVDGTKMLNTSSVAGKGLVYGDFGSLYIANFGGLDITVDTISQAAYGNVRLVVNTYWDFKMVRDNAIKYAELA